MTADEFIGWVARPLDVPAIVTMLGVGAFVGWVFVARLAFRPNSGLVFIATLTILTVFVAFLLVVRAVAGASGWPFYVGIEILALLFCVGMYGGLRMEQR